MKMAVQTVCVGYTSGSEGCSTSLRFNEATIVTHTFPKALTVDQSRSSVTTDGQSVSPSWCRVPSGAHDQMLCTV
jgi:hypothetical protein